MAVPLLALAAEAELESERVLPLSPMAQQLGTVGGTPLGQGQVRTFLQLMEDL